MKYIEVRIKEKDKKRKKLTLFNLRDELVNFMYKDTVADSSRTDQRFYLLIYFASLQANDKTFLETLLDTALPRFKSLNEDLSSRKKYLVKHEYNEAVKKHGLTEFFAHDVLFILCEAIIEIEDIENKYKDLYEDNDQFMAVLSILKSDYRPLIIQNYSLFTASRIKDERVDDNGFTHDLSKGVYRTIMMRNAKKFEVNLQRYTRVKKVTSESPIILDIIQIVDPQIIFDLWNKYHVFDYVTGVWKFINDNPVLSGAAGAIVAQPVIEKYNSWRASKLSKDNKETRQARKEAFKVAQSQNAEQLDAINLRLVKSVMDANDHLLDEVAFLKRTLEKEQSKGAAINEEEVKSLKSRIEKLENIEVTTSEIKESETLTLAIESSD